MPNFTRHLYLFRHGQTNAVDENIRHSLESNRHLTDDGIAQVSNLANQLADKQIDVFFVSPHNRSLHTANIVAQNHVGAPIIIDDRLSDGIYYLWQTTNPNDAVESAKTFERVQCAMNDILATKYQNIAISSHGGITRAIMKICGYDVGGVGTGKYFHLGFDGNKWTWIQIYG